MSPQINTVEDLFNFAMGSQQKLVQAMEKSRTHAKSFEENDETFWEVVTKMYPYARAIYNAFKDNFNARLFIIVVSEGTLSKIHFITKQELSPELIITQIDVLIEAKTMENEIKPRWVELGKKILNNEEQDIIDSGNRFQDYLLMGYLFSIDAEFENELNERIVSDGLKEKFKDNSFPLSSPSLSSIIKKGEWEITDKKRKYALTIEDETLNIYLKSTGKWLNSYLSGKNIVPQCDNPFGVWVYCEDKNFYPLWEWLYDGSSFWGDNYHIIRVPPKKESKDFKIGNFAILSDGACSLTAGDTSCVKGCGKIHHESIELSKIFERLTKNYYAFDGIHVVADIKTDTKGECLSPIESAVTDKEAKTRLDSYNKESLFSFSKFMDEEQQKKFSDHLATINTSFSQLIKTATYSKDGDEQIKIIRDGCEIAELNIKEDLCIFKREGKAGIKIGIVRREGNVINIYPDVTEPHFLFLNTCGSNEIRSKIMELYSPDTWIVSNIKITGKLASIFAKEFYNEFCCERRTVEEAFIEAREKIKAMSIDQIQEIVTNQEDEEHSKVLWRLAYVLNGNPCAKIQLGN